MCSTRVRVQDSAPFLMRTSIPPPLRYPVSSIGFAFVHALCKLFYGSASMQCTAALQLCRLMLVPIKRKQL